MPHSRRSFVANTALLTATGSAAMTSDALAAKDDAAETTFTLYPIGKVEKQEAVTRIRVFEKFADGLLGLEQWSHVSVFYWFDKNDTPQKRGVLQVHPRGNPENPLTGVFACRSPVRPNLIALSVCQIVSVADGVITIDGIDAFDGTPVIDLKPTTPADGPRQGFEAPTWKGRPKQDAEGA